MLSKEFIGRARDESLFDGLLSSNINVENASDLVVASEVQAFGECLNPCVYGDNKNKFINDISPRAETRYLYKVENAHIIGWDTVLSEGGLVFSGYASDNNEKLGKIISRLGSSNHHGCFCIGERIFFNRPNLTYKFSGVGAFIGGLEPSNYGSFIIRILPRLLWLSTLNLKLDYLVVPQLTPWVRECIDLILTYDLPIYQASDVFGLTHDYLYVMVEPEMNGAIDKASYKRINGIRERLQKNISGMNFSKYNYCSRRLQSNRRPKYRPLVNEQEVEDVLLKRGFKIINPESLSLKKQILVFFNTDILVGPSGSGMLNAVFMRNRTKVTELEGFTNNINQHARLYSTTQKLSNFLFGSTLGSNGPVFKRPWSIDISILDGLIEDSL